jgi:hypothetical protein
MAEGECEAEPHTEPERLADSDGDTLGEPDAEGDGVAEGEPRDECVATDAEEEGEGPPLAEGDSDATLAEALLEGERERERVTER